jgi:quercetin dioxygenase-like cupin family protein
MKTILLVLSILIVTLVVTLIAEEKKHQAATQHGTAAHAILLPNQLKWKDGPPGLPPGAQFVILEGDPSKEGPFTMRAKIPDGYRIPPHTHPKVEHVTVLSGTMHFGMGEKFNESATQPMPAGTFGYWPAGMAHFVRIEGETILQVHGVGPWGIDYLNPEDDPRKTTAKEAVSK